MRFQQNMGRPKVTLTTRQVGGRARKLRSVVCVLQGEITEYKYLLTIISLYNNSTLDVIIDADMAGSDPLRLAHYTLNRYKNTSIYDCVYCIFDRDTFPKDNYDNAVRKFLEAQQQENEQSARDQAQPRIYKAVTSSPCFELWLIQHFKYFAKPQCAGVKKSPCDQISKELETILRKDQLSPKLKYTKDTDIFNGKDFNSIKAMVQKAITHSKRLCECNKKIGEVCPETNMHELVQIIVNTQCSIS